MKIEKIALPIAILLSAIILAVGYYAVQINKQNSAERQQSIEREMNQKIKNESEQLYFSLKDTKDDLTFDIDVFSLSYQLPFHTKMCLPDTKQQCSESECKPIKPTVFILYDEENSLVYRCDEKPCDSYEVVRNESGLFTVLEPIETRAFSVKLSSNNKYTETVGFGLDTLVSHGTCR